MKLSNGCNHLFHILSHIQQILEYGLCNTHLSCRMTHIILSSFNKNAPNLDHPNLDPFQTRSEKQTVPGSLASIKESGQCSPSSATYWMCDLHRWSHFSWHSSDFRFLKWGEKVPISKDCLRIKWDSMGKQLEGCLAHTKWSSEDRSHY